jgi:hypothetical protein
MPRTTVNLELFRTGIEHRLLTLKESREDVVRWLATQGISITSKTLQLRCKEWGMGRHTAIPASDSTLIAEIECAFNTTFDNDETIAQKLNSRGLQTTPNQVKEIRLKNNWRRRAANAEQMNIHRTETFARVEALLKEGSIRQSGREFVQITLRVEQHYQAREDDVRDALKAFDPKGTEARKPGPRKRRKRGGEYIVRGPDWLWSIDQHDKFRNYGIQIYAGVDAYSRRILWIYVGNSNRTKMSILRQALVIIRKNNRCPRFYRADRGKEVLLADSHCSFYKQHKKKEGMLTD